MSNIEVACIIIIVIIMTICVCEMVFVIKRGFFTFNDR